MVSTEILQSGIFLALFFVFGSLLQIKFVLFTVYMVSSHLSVFNLYNKSAIMG